MRQLSPAESSIRCARGEETLGEGVWRSLDAQGRSLSLAEAIVEAKEDGRADERALNQ